MRVLLVEDSARLRQALDEGLRLAGYAVDSAVDGGAALEFLRSYDYDLMVLDLMLPRVDGLDVLRELRNRRVPVRVLVLSARDQVADRVAALHAGADDYLVKPFSFDELKARLQALSRRELQAPAPALQVGRLRLDPAARSASVDDQPLLLSPKEYALLEMLVRNRGRPMARHQLFEHIYDARSHASDKVIEVLMSTLRAKLAQFGADHMIETRRGVGYVLADVRV